MNASEQYFKGREATSIFKWCWSYHFLCLCVHFFQVLDVLLLDHENLGQSCLVKGKKTDKECIRMKSYKVLGCEIFIFHRKYLPLGQGTWQEILPEYLPQHLVVCSSMVIGWWEGHCPIITGKEKNDNEVIFLHNLLEEICNHCTDFFCSCSVMPNG